MMTHLEPILIVGIIFSVCAYVIKILSDNRIRQRIIESGQLDEKLKYLYLEPKKGNLRPLNSIKWGLVLIGLGLALFLGRLFPYTIVDEMTFGLMFLFAGIAFIIYYFMAKSRLEENGNSM